jgi:hypothetical protein
MEDFLLIDRDSYKLKRNQQITMVNLTHLNLDNSPNVMVKRPIIQSILQDYKPNPIVII